MKYAVVTLVYMLFVIATAILPNPIKSESANYLIHGAAYFLLATAFFFTFRSFNYIKNPTILSIILSIIIAISTEFLQLLVSYRTFNQYDILASTLGSLFAITWGFAT